MGGGVTNSLSQIPTLDWDFLDLDWTGLDWTKLVTLEFDLGLSISFLIFFISG